jgi:phage baseplate assembly protein gpV
MNTRHLLAVASVAVLVPTGAAQASSLKGTVVHHNHKAHSFVVANASGRMSAVHATRTPRVGSKVTVTASQLANGTFNAARIHARGRAHHARLRGIVTFVDRRHRRFTLSDNGASVLVRFARTHKARQADLPTPGSQVTVVSDLDRSDDSSVVTTPGAVQTDQAPSAGQPVDIEGSILAVDTTSRTLTISADDDNASGQAISVVLPASFDITRFAVGDEIEIAATLNPDGTSYTALASSGDDNADEADNAGDAQGDDNQFDDHGDQAAGTPSGADDQSGSGDGSGSGSGDHSGSGSDS